MIGDTIKEEAGKAGKVICAVPCSPHSHRDAGNWEHLLIEPQGTAEAAPEIAHAGCRWQGRRTRAAQIFEAHLWLLPCASMDTE